MANGQQSLPECGQDKGDLCGHHDSTHILLWAFEDLSWAKNTSSLATYQWLTNDFISSLSRGEPESQPPSRTCFGNKHPESIPTCCITVWYRACTASCCKTLHGIVRAAEKICGTPPPPPFHQSISSTHLTLQLMPHIHHRAFPAFFYYGKHRKSVVQESTRESGNCSLYLFCPPTPPPFWAHKLWTLSLWQGDSKIREQEYHTK